LKCLKCNDGGTWYILLEESRQQKLEKEWKKGTEDKTGILVTLWDAIGKSNVGEACGCTRDRERERESFACLCE
jgi:hypothetical protein